MKVLSIIIPVYNEQTTIYEVIEKVNAVELPNGITKNIVVVDDQSSDNSLTRVKDYDRDFPGIITVLEHKVNKGKGAGIRSSLSACIGDYIIIQDADLELNPNEYNNLIAPILSGEANIVFGSRFLNNNKADQGSFLSRTANKFLTGLSNLAFRTKLTDMETCYKLVPSSFFKHMILKEDRFGFEPEITAKLAKIPSARFQEIPITYIPRTTDAGKKIGWKDGVRATYCIVKYGWFSPKRKSFSKPVDSL
jgi:glycosyltransferase involved in cell wall biosynthesis